VIAGGDRIFSDGVSAGQAEMPFVTIQTAVTVANAEIRGSRVIGDVIRGDGLRAGWRHRKRFGHRIEQLFVDIRFAQCTSLVTRAQGLIDDLLVGPLDCGCVLFKDGGLSALGGQWMDRQERDENQESEAMG
jgi:hypothetical protein